MKEKNSTMGETDIATASTETETTKNFTETTQIRFVQVTNFYYNPEESLETVQEEEAETSDNAETVHEETITTDIDETVNEEEMVNETETETNKPEIDQDVMTNDEETTHSEENHSFEELSLDSTNNSADNCVGKENLKNLITDIDDPDRAVETDIHDTNGKCIDINEKNSATKQSGDDKNSRDKEESSGKKKNKEKKSRKLKKSKSFVNQFRQCLPIGQGQR